MCLGLSLSFACTVSRSQLQYQLFTGYVRFYPGIVGYLSERISDFANIVPSVIGLLIRKSMKTWLGLQLRTILFLNTEHRMTKVEYPTNGIPLTGHSLHFSLKNLLIHLVQLTDLDNFNLKFLQIQAFDGVFGDHDLLESKLFCFGNSVFDS